ncbi:cytochrome c biogenesis protein CcsA [Massilibacteroides sp.]|uniref:cytochrome c biogenesis protein CcsA n=1 Tax=Massilibacteroides sp. TaxID=2034766 RepID=UPI00262CF3C9|nr:cytochrome c biogenesis protein CcsA [Massilibacteroides sp.]MDD4516729.1 cytochrome c biogenesis protein CcsA [Massilibacteroides sp.]
MKAKIERILSSYVTTIVLLIIYALGLAFATFIEKYHGTAAAKAMIYYSPVFIMLQFLMIVNFIYEVIEHQLLKKKKWGFMVIHIAFIVVLGGALTTHLFGKEGVLHIREGAREDRMMMETSEGRKYQSLPFAVELKKFTLTRYPGSASPSSYESDLVIHVDGKTISDRVFMNNVIDIKGYRLFQASYDKDEKGTVLSVNQDVAGRTITYIGYAMLLIGFILSFVGHNSRFRQLGRQLKTLRGTAVVLLFGCSFLFPVNIKSESPSMLDAVLKYTISPEHAEKFGALPIQASNGRMIPVNTFSSEILRKLHKENKFKNLNSDQFLLSLLAMPDMWMRIPVITHGNKDLANHYDLSTDKTCSYVDVFDSNGQYKLQESLEEAYHKMPSERNRFDKDIIKLDEQVNILHQLFNQQMLNLFPKEDDPGHKWYAPGDDLSAFSGKDSMFVSRIMEWYLGEVQNSLQSRDWSKADEVLGMITTYQNAKNKTLSIDQKKIQAELTYNKLEIFRYCKIFYLILGGLSLVFAFFAMFQFQRWMRWAKWLLAIAIVVVFLYQTAGMGMRWYIAGYAPWSNSYETMVYVAWATVVGGLFFLRKSTMTFALATLFGGIILFVSGLNWMDPQINPLVPVLKSPWLMFHVAVIVAAYGFFGISSLIGITNLVLMSFGRVKNEDILISRMKELSLINEMSLHVGIALMTIGTFLGAIWANESWGRYWGWDPKETWALITIVVYAIVTHLRHIKKYQNYWLFNLTSIVAIASVLMTFFGVNYFLSGMHSYGSNDAVGGIFMYLYIVLGVILFLAVISWYGWQKWPLEKKKFIH